MSNNNNNNPRKKTKGELYLERMDMEERDPNFRPDVTDSSSSSSEGDFSEVLKPRKNTFKYVSFRERVNNVDINVFLPPSKGVTTTAERYEAISARQQATLSDTETFFSSALYRWREYDTSTHYATAFSELSGLCHSLPLELLNRDKIVDILLRHLAIPRNPSYPAFLNLLSHLSRDLRSEFYPRLRDVLTFLAGTLLDPSQPELLEAVFTTISYFFKFLQRQLLDDIDSVVDWFSTLVGHWKDYVRSFAAESAAFLVRKVPPTKIPDVIARVVALVESQATENAANGVAALLFETVRGSRNEFHSAAPAILTATFAQLRFAEGESDLVMRLKFLAVWRFAKMMQRHVRNARNPLLWPILVEEIRTSVQSIINIKKQINNNNENGNKHENEILYNGERIALFMSIMSEWISYHNGAIVPLRAMAGHVSGVLRAVFVPEIDSSAGKNCHLQALRLLENLFLLTKLIEEEEEEGEKRSSDKYPKSAKRFAAEYGGVSSIVGLALNPPRDPEAIFTFCMTRKRRDEETFRKYVFNSLAAYISRNAVPENYPAIIAFVEQLVAGDLNEAPSVPATGVTAENTVLAKTVVPIVVKVLTSSADNRLLWAAYRIVPAFIPVLSAADASAIYNCAIDGIRAHLSPEKTAARKYHRQTAYEAFNVVSNMLVAGKAGEIGAAELRELFVGLVRAFHAIPAFLRVGHDFLQNNADMVCAGSNDEGRSALFAEVMGIVTENFYSKNRDLRLGSVRILEPIAPTPAAAEALRWCDVVESTPLSVTDLRDFTVNLELVERKVRAETFPAEVFPMIVPFVIGTLHIKFSPVWPFSKTALITLFKKHSNDAWPCFIRQLEDSENELLAFWNTSSDASAANDFVEAEIGSRIVVEDGEEEEGELDAGGEDDDEPSSKRARELIDSYIPESIVERRERENIGYKELEELYEDAKEANEYTIPPYTDIFTYNGMLWDVLESVHEVIEKDNRSEKIVTFFMNFAQQNKMSIFRFLRDKSFLIDDEAEAEAEGGKGEDIDEDDKRSVDELFTLAARSRKPTSEQMAKMTCFMRVFSRMNNPKKVHRSKDLKEIFTQMLEIPSPKIQKLALTCLIVWRARKLRPYRAHFMRLLDDRSLNDELTRFTINDPKVVDPAHRHIVADTLVHVLWPFLKKRSNRRKRGIPPRVSVLSYFATFDDESIPLVMDRIILPIEKHIEGKAVYRTPYKSFEILIEFLENINFRAGPFFPRILTCVHYFLEKYEKVFLENAAYENSKKRSIDENDNNNNEEEEEEDNDEGNEVDDEEERIRRNNKYVYSSEMRSICIKILEKLVHVFPEMFKSENEGNAGYMTKIVECLGRFIAMNLNYSRSHDPSGLFACFLAMSCSEHTLPFVAQNAAVFPGMVSYVSSKKDKARSDALSFIENVLELAPTCQVARDMLTANAPAIVRGLNVLFTERERRKRQKKRKMVEGNEAANAGPSCAPGLLALRQRAIKILAAVGVSNSQKVSNSEFNAITMHILDFVIDVQNAEARSAELAADAKIANEEMMMGFVKIVDQIFSTARPVRSVVLRVASLLQRQQNRKLRVCIATVFSKIAAAIPGFEEVGRFVADINAYNIKSLTSIYDYDARQRAFNMILDNETTGFLTRMRSHLEYYIVYSALIHNAYDEDPTMRENALATLEIFFATLERKYGPGLTQTSAVDSSSDTAAGAAGDQENSIISTSKPKEIRSLVVKDIYKSVCKTLLNSFKAPNSPVFPASFSVFRMLGVHFPKLFHDLAVLSAPVYEKEAEVKEDEEKENEIEVEEDGNKDEEVKEEENENDIKEEENEDDVKEEIKEEIKEEDNVKEEEEEIKEEEEEEEGKEEQNEETKEVEEETKEEKTVLFGKCFIPHFSDFSLEGKVKALEHFCAVLLEERKVERSFAKTHSLWLSIFLKMAENYDTLFKVESHSFLDALGNAIAAVHDTLDWSEYYPSVMGILKFASKHAEEKKLISNILTSVICKILEKFHFAVASKEEVDKEERRKSKKKQRESDDEDDEDDDDIDMSDKEEDEDDDEDKEENEDEDEDDEDNYDEQYMIIRRSLKLEEISAKLTLSVQANLAITQQFVPILMKKLTDGKDTNLGGQRMALARAIVRLLLLLPNREGDTQIRQLIIVLCQTLQEKDDFELRENARAALCDLTSRLGPAYFGDVVHELRFALKRGIQLHVLGYTMNKVLASIYTETERMHKAGQPCDQGVFDAVIPDVVDVLFEDLIGITGRQKDIRELAKGKKQNKMSETGGKAVTVVELGKSTAYQSFRLLAALAKFEGSDAGFGGVGKLVRPIVERIRKNDIGNDVKKLEVFVNVLKHIVMGISRNRTTSTKVLLEFSYVLIKNNILPSDKEKKAAEAAARLRMTPEELEEERRKNSPRYLAMQEAKKKFLVFKNLSQTKKKVANEASSNAYIVANFGFSLLESAIRKLSKRLKYIDSALGKESDAEDNGEEMVVEDGNDDEGNKKKANENRLDNNMIVALVDPFVSILVKCLNDNQQMSVIQSAISVLSVLAPHNAIPSVVSSGGKIIKKTVAIIKLGAASSAGLVCSSLQMLSALFARGYYRDVAEHYVTDVIEYAAAQLAEADQKYGGSHPDAEFLMAVLGLLQTVVGQSLVTPHIYDMVDTAARLSIISPVEEVRALCSRIAVKFFCAYPAESARKVQVVDFFVKNTEYATVVGRKSALETMDALLRAVSGDANAEDRKVIGERLEVIYLTLVNRFINEPEIELKTFILRGVLHSFVAAFAGDEGQLDLLLTLTFDLLRNSKKVLIKQAVLQLTSVFLAVEPKRFIKRYTAVALPYVSEVIAAAAALTAKTLEDEERQEASLHRLFTVKRIQTAEERKQRAELPTFKEWEIVYHALGSLERVINENNAFAFAPELRGVWDNIVTLFAYRHAWVQLICLRLVYGVLSRLDARKLAEMVVLESRSRGSGDKKKSDIFVLDIDFVYAAGLRLIGHIGGNFTTDVSMSCSLKLLVALTNIFALCNNEAVPTAVSREEKACEKIKARRKRLEDKKNDKKDKKKKDKKKEEDEDDNDEEEEGWLSDGDIETERPKSFLSLFKLLRKFSKLTEFVASPKRCLVYKWFAALILILTKTKKLKIDDSRESQRSSDTKVLNYITKPKESEGEVVEEEEEEKEKEEEEEEETLEEEGIEFMKTCITLIMGPLYRSSTETQTVIKNEKSIANGTLKIVRSAIGDKAYFEAYNVVRSQAVEKSTVSEQEKKRLAILDPKLNSKRKLRESKKRTNAKFEDQRTIRKQLEKRGTLIKVLTRKERTHLKSDTTPLPKPRNPMKK